jgi:maleylacetoacetate isomerase
MILYTAAHSNTADRVQWVLNYKQIPHQRMNAEELGREEYLQINPYGYIPTLKVGAVCLSESMAIVEYLEAHMPKPTVLPGDHLKRAQIREVCEYINSTVHPVQNRSIMLRFRPDFDAEAMRAWRAEWLMHSLGVLARSLWKESHYAVGASFSMADIFVAVMYQRALRQGLLADSLPAFAQHFQALMQIPAISQSAPF